MTIEVFLMLLLAVSVFTSLTVEAIKNFMGEKYNAPSNILAGITAVILSVVVGVFYCILASVAFSSHIVIILIALVFLSWLCSMVGYDKVIQAITQIKTK